MAWFKKPAREVDDISGNMFDRAVVWRILPYLKEEWPTFAFCLSLVFISTGIALYSPRLLGTIVDSALLTKNKSLLWKLTGIFVGLEVVRLIALYSQSYYLQKIGQGVMHRIRSDLFGRLMRMPIAFFDRNPVGRLVTRVTNDTANLSEIFSAGFVTLFSDVLIIVGVLAAVLVMDFHLGLIAISVFPIMILLMFFFAGWLRIAFRRSRETLSRLNGYFAEQMSAMPIVQMMEREKFERENYKKISETYREHQFAGVNLYSLFHPAITILSAVSMALLLYYGGRGVMEKSIPLGTYVALLAYIQILYQPVRSITDKFNIFLAAMSSAERIFALLELKEEDGLRSQSDSIAPLQGRLEFRNAKFSYQPDVSEPKWALKDVSFKISPGERIAIVGHTGAGKSTLLSLLFRFYDLQSGAILLDGRDLREFPKHELRRRIGFVQQDVFLFAGTVRENLVLLNQSIREEEILLASKITGLTPTLQRLPEGLDTELDERGSNLSQGERQILAFTRTYLQRPDILVLDEATASIDGATEIQIQNATDALMAGRTSIVIAHRLSTIRHSDRIFVFDHGELLEAGKHDELVAKGGVYARFVSLQSSTGAQSTLSN